MQGGHLACNVLVVLVCVLSIFVHHSAQFDLQCKLSAVQAHYLGTYKASREVCLLLT